MKMNKLFFIMVYNQDGSTASTIVDGEKPDYPVDFYATEAEARKMAEGHPYCKAFGYEIFELGTGA